MAIVTRTEHTVAGAWAQRKRTYSDGNRRIDGRTVTGLARRCEGIVYMPSPVASAEHQAFVETLIAAMRPKP